MQPVQAGTFARASEEELKGRKIIKARRPGQASASAANPFAAVSLTSSSGNPFAGVSLLGTKPNLAAIAQVGRMKLKTLEMVQANALRAVHILKQAASPPSATPAAEAPVISSPSKQQAADGSADQDSHPSAASPDLPEAAAARATATPASTPVKPAAPATQSFSTFANSTASAFAVTASSAAGFAFGNPSAPAGACLTRPKGHSGNHTVHAKINA